MNVLEVISSLKPIGGGENFAVSLSIALNKKVNLTVAILYDDYSEFFIEKLKENNVNFVFLSKQKGLDLRCAKRLAKLIKEKNIEYIHTENNAIITTYLALRKLHLLRKIPILHTLHTIPGVEDAGLSGYIFRHIFRKGYAVAVNIIDNDEFKKHLKVPFIPLVENGVDLSSYDSSIKLEDREFDAVMIGRFTKQKNHVLALDIFKKIAQVRPSFIVRLYGAGPLFNDIQELVNSNNLQNNVLLMGAVPNAEIASILGKTKILFMPSIWEMKSITIIESLASGTIPIVSDCPGNRTIIHDDVNGYVVSNDKPDEYANKVLAILENPSSYQDMANRCVESSKKYSIDECAEHYLALFNQKGSKNQS